jgi:ABC-type nitrate/sulfonate/bicarbonate transport system substrate-binding protein
MPILNALQRGIVAAAVLLCAAQAHGEKVTVGVTGPPNAMAWPFYVAIDKGFFAAQDITFDIVSAP